MVSATSPTADDSEHSVLEDDSDTEMDRDYIEDDELMEEDDDDGSSSLSIPNESIDFDLVYSLHSFAATVEGQANVVKGDSLYLMDDSNSYWWLVRVLKTQEVGYIPAENIETPFERLARLNKHRNIDLASATQAELQDGLQQSQDRLRQNLNNSRQGRTDSPSGSQSRLAKAKSVIFTAGLHVHRYPPAVWNEEEYEEEEGDEEDEWDIGEYEDEDPGLAAEQAVLERAAARAAASQSPQSVPQQQPVVMEPDDEMQWDDRVTEEIQAQQMAQRQQLQVQQQGPSPSPTRGVVPDQTRISPTSPSPIANTTPLSVSTAQNGQRRLVADPFSEFDSPNATDPSSPPGSSSTHETVRLTMTPTIARDSVFESQQAATYSTSADKKRRTEEEEAEEARKRARGALSPTGNAANTTPVKSGPAPTGGKLRKERDRSDSASGSIEDDASSNTSGKEKKKKTGVFGALFSRKKDKKDGGSKDLRDVANSSGKEKPVEADIVVGRVSDSSDVRSHRPSASSGGASVSSGTSDAGPMSPTTTMAMQQQQAMIVPSTPPQAHQHPAGLVPGGGASSFGSMNSALSSTPPSSLSSSPAAQTLRQRDQAQQALYQQYLNRSPASPPDLVPNYGLQSASVVNTGNRWTRDTSGSTAQSGLAPPASTPRQRPGSLILTPEALASNPIAASISQSPSFASSTGPSATSPSAAQTQAITELSVVRIFAGRGLEDDTEATFKTVLLNSQTGAAELVRQAVQRFRLNVPSGDEYSSDEEGVQMVDGLKEKLAGPSRHYYLTIKQIEGGASVKLRPDDKPLAVFEALVEDARIAREEREREERERELAARTGGIMATPKVKRSSVGSISSVASNLSMHPAIKRLPMNDFTDDSAVKFYLHRKGAEHEDNGDEDDGADGLGYRDEEDADETLIAADTSISSSVAEHDASISSPSTSTRLLVPPHATERLSSPSARFALQLVIHQEDLPDDMVFDTVTEAIIFKGTVRDREGKRHSHASSVSNTSVANSIPQNLRRKVFIFPKNVTVAEVIELGLERFGILEGVVDGGDEVEDKLTKRRSNASRVRYGLTAAIGDTEKELSPASRIIDAYPRPPVFRTEKRTKELHRRSMDSTQILGNMDDISLDDPVFILRRATSYRNSTSRHRMSAPLDELALRNLHQQIKRDSAASSARSGTDSTPISPSGSAHGQGVFAQQQDVKKQPSRKEIIAAQREALRATQRAILSTQTNSHRGVDVLLPGNARLRSSRYEADDRMRYSYVQPDGEIYDVSDIVEEELNPIGSQHHGPGSGRRDLLEGVVTGKAGVPANEKLDRVLGRIKNEKSGQAHTQARRSVSPTSQYSLDDTVEAYGRSRSVTPAGSVASVTTGPRVVGAVQRAVSPASTIGGRMSPTGSVGTRPGTVTPTGAGGRPDTRRNPSIASVMSDLSGYATPATHPMTPSPVEFESSRSTSGTPKLPHSSPLAQHQRQRSAGAPKPVNTRPPLPKDDFGVSHMMAIIEYKASKNKGMVDPPAKVDPVDDMLFGRQLDLASLHPKIRDIYADSFRQMDELDKFLDDQLARAQSKA
ncbi:protein phosphatase regulator [Paramarasmius palmivorus]|uniref:Protein phosphatase regulator n=1 Tax=Paramarasmius palmivorus TaxID=297713 RepID=A0AAW0DWC1_9AGAR